jgi:hypothetical protein
VPTVVRCDEEDNQPAAILIHNLETGDMVAICAEHWPAWIRTLHDALGPGPQEIPADEATAAAEAAGEGEATQSTPPRKRRQGRRQNGSQDLASEASPLRDATPVDP